MKEFHHFVATLVISLAVLGMAACNSSNAVNGAASPTNEGPNPQVAIEATGWTELKLLAANSANTNLSQSAHYDTSRNACGYPQYGAISLALWNSVADSLNTVAASTLLPDDKSYCLDVPGTTWPYMNGEAQLVLLDGSRRSIFKPGNSWEVCTTIADHDLAKKLLDYLTQIVLLADKDHCPNGWGSS